MRAVIRRARLEQGEAEDLIADAMAKLVRLRPIARNPQALLVTSAMNLLHNARKRDARIPLLHSRANRFNENSACSVLEMVVDESTDPLALLGEDEEQAARRAELRAAIDRLPVTDRLLLTAYYFEGRSLGAIDEARGDLPGTAAVRLHRARNRLRDSMGSTERDSSRWR